MRNTIPIRLVIADDHEIYRDGLAGLFSGAGQYEVVELCQDGDHLVRAVRLHQPDVVITDLRMPGTGGVKAIRVISEKFPAVRVLVLTIMDHEYMIVKALEAGARGYIIKDAPKKDVFEAVDNVYKNIPYYCRHTTAKLVRLISNSYFNPYEREKQQPSTNVVLL